jgi:hypothetical protein
MRARVIGSEILRRAAAIRDLRGLTVGGIIFGLHIWLRNL